ncbi:hypothetical protein V5O48_010745 [Marasmius crinis-equi]|uniref:Uncharacterized protein n=1 Tax=Marasmius crinis-equi TaxID=585013 RepID=A0ABR3F7J6_9AGAR
MFDPNSLFSHVVQRSNLDTQNSSPASQKQVNNSLSNAKRQHKTDTPAQLVDFIKTAPLKTKAKKNFTIRKRNEARKNKDALSLEKPDNPACMPGSHQASEWSFSEEQEKQLRVKLTYDDVKEWLLSTKSAAGGGDEELRRRICLFLSLPILTIWLRRAPKLLTYPEFAHTAPIPLGLFACENLEYINSSRHLIHFKKQTLPGSKSSVHVVDMAKLCKDRNISMKDTKNLTITQFSYVADCWWAFEAEKEKRHGVSLYATWAGKHLAAWESFPERESMFAIWKPKELKQKNKRYSKSLAFNNLDYMSARDCVLNTYELEQKLVEERIRT